MYFYETKKENHVPNETESEWALSLSHSVYTFKRHTHICEEENKKIIIIKRLPSHYIFMIFIPVSAWMSIFPLELFLLRFDSMQTREFSDNMLCTHFSIFKWNFSMEWRFINGKNTKMLAIKNKNWIYFYILYNLMSYRKSSNKQTLTSLKF